MVLTQCLQTSRSSRIAVAHAFEIADQFMLTKALQDDPQGDSAPLKLVNFPTGGTSLRHVELFALDEALRLCHGVQVDAAAMLGISPRAFSYKLRGSARRTRCRPSLIRHLWDASCRCRNCGAEANPVERAQLQISRRKRTEAA